MGLDMDVANAGHRRRLTSPHSGLRGALPTSASSTTAFTLVELLVVLAIIALLTALLLTSAAAVRRQANTVACASNLSQIAKALLLYQTDWKKLPPNDRVRRWCETPQLDKYIPSTIKETDDVRNPVLRCPSDDIDAYLSYSMNFWASGELDQTLAANGKQWTSGVKNASQMILLVDTYSSQGSASSGYSSVPIVGWHSRGPKRWFGAPVVAPVDHRRHGRMYSQLAYSRHRGRSVGPDRGRPEGRVNIAYLDGHVELKSYEELVNVRTNQSTYESLWTQADRELDLRQ